MITMGSEVEWRYPGGIERGQVVEVSGDHVRIEYGPWSDSAWFPIVVVWLRGGSPQ